MTQQQLSACPSCNAKPGELHRLSCDVERCTFCGSQLLSCDHFSLDGPTSPADADRLPWTGEWPGVEACRTFGWYAKYNPDGSGYIPCQADDPQARPDLNRLMREAFWDREQRQFINLQELHGYRLVRLWRNKFLTLEAKTLDEMVDGLQEAVDELRAMRDNGVQLEADTGVGDDHAQLITDDPGVASRFGFHLELPEDEEELEDQETAGTADTDQPERNGAKPPVRSD